MEFSRFDIDETVQAVIKEAVAVGAVDEIDVFAIAIEYGCDWDKVVEDIVKAAYSMIHYDSKAHSAVVEKAEQYWKKRIESQKVIDI